MKILKVVAFGAIIAALTACSSVETVTRNAPMEQPRAGLQAATQVQRDYTVHSIRFAVPSDMTVSEANSYYPIADIVWRGDPIGNRAEQISAMFRTSILAAGENLNGSTPVTVDVQLARFHSLTERTRYSVGGVNSIKFDLTIRDAATGAILEPTRRIDADFGAPGGSAAIAADRAGQTEKVQVIARLTDVFLRELSGAGPSATVGQAGL